MKRTLLLILGGLLLLLVGAVAVLRLPATQGWLLRRAVADVPGLTLRVERVSAGWNEAELRGVEANYEGTRVRLPRLVARYDGWALLTRRELIVDEFVANDAEVTLAPAAAETSGSGGGAEMLGSLLAPLQLPLRATIGGVQLGGRVLVSTTQTLSFSAQGQLLQPGRAASLDLNAGWTDQGAVALARDLDWVGRLTTTAAAGGAVERLELLGTLAVRRPTHGAAEPGLETRLLVARATDGAETAELGVRLTIAKAQEPALARLALHHGTGAERVTGEWNVNARREQFAGIVDLEQLPDFTIAAQGTLGVELATGDFSAEGKATGFAARLQRLRSEFGVLGALTTTLDFAVERHGDEVQLARLNAAVNDARGPVVTLAALQPVTYRLSTRAVSYARPLEDLGRLEFGNLPLAWAQPWLTDAIVGGAVSGGEVRLRGAGGAWSVETARPITFAGVRYGSGGQIFADQLGGELKLRASVDGAAWAVQQLDLALRSAAAPAPGAISLHLEAQQDAAGAGRMKLPFTLENSGRRSQLTIEGEWATAAGGPKLTARVSGDIVYLRDVAGLAALMPARGEPVATTPAAPKGKTKAAAAPSAGVATKDTRAFWAGVDGRAEIDLRRLVLETEEITGLQATLVCDARQLSLQRLVAQARKAPLDAKLAVTFDSAKATPYLLQGSCSFPGFDLGAWMRAANPNEPPAIETVLNVTAKLEGQGTNLDSLVNGVRGEFVLQGGPGVLRIKDKRIEAASQLGGLVLGLLSKEKQQKAAVVAGSQLLEEMREFRFERIDASLSRGEDLNLQFRTFDVRSAEKRLSGSGVARHVAGATIDAYPLQLEMRLAGKENFGALLDKAGLLDGTKDELGYTRMREAFTVTGTVGEPNWKRMLAQLAAGLAFGK